MSTAQDVAKHMGSIVASDPKLLAECEQICSIYAISAETLKYKWEALTFTSHSRSEQLPVFTMDSIASLKAVLQRDLQKQAASKKAPRRMPGNGMANVNRMRIPQNFGRSPIGTAHLAKNDAMNDSIPGPSQVTFKGPKTDASAKKKRAYHYMYEKLIPRSEVLDDRIDEFAELVRQHHGISELATLNNTSGEEIVVVGRINRDAETPESAAKLTEPTITIECSRMYDGDILPLRFEPGLKIRRGVQGAGGLGLFPGAIVAVKGRNGGAGLFLASEILTLPPPSYPPPPPSSFTSSFSLCVACGPFTRDVDTETQKANLDFEPYQNFLRSVSQSKPAVLLLIGPFLDTSHPRIRDGDTDLTPVQLFRKKITEPLRSFLDSSPGSIALLVPGIRDLLTDHPVYPQPEFNFADVSMNDSRIKCLPNPALFTLNDVRVAVSSVDVIFHLRKEELLKRGEETESIPSTPEDGGTDVTSNLCRHLLQQRSFYPIFPVPYDLTSEVNLDVSHSDGLKLTDDNNHAPDILITPSRLKQFSKFIHSTLAINPSFLTKGIYSTITVEPNGSTLSERFKSESTRLDAA